MPCYIEDLGKAVGVVALVDQRRQTGELALFRLLIDAGQQRRGYGRAAVRGAIRLARQLEGCDRLRLTVDHQNQAAIALYQSEGFVLTGSTPTVSCAFPLPLPRAAPREVNFPESPVVVPRGTTGEHDQLGRQRAASQGREWQSISG